MDEGGEAAGRRRRSGRIEGWTPGPLGTAPLVDTRTIAILALIIAVIVLLLLVL